MAKLIIGLVGDKGAGKGTMAQHLSTKYQAVTFAFPQILKDILARLYIPNTRKNLSDLALALRKLFGDDVLGQTIHKDIDNSNASIITLDGIRYFDEVKLLKEFPMFYLVYITADVKLRYSRVKMRGEKENETTMTFEEFLEEEKLQTELQIKDIAKTANFNVVNNGSKEEFYLAIGTLMDKLLYNEGGMPLEKQGVLLPNTTKKEGKKK